MSEAIKAVGDDFADGAGMQVEKSKSPRAATGARASGSCSGFVRVAACRRSNGPAGAVAAMIGLRFLFGGAFLFAGLLHVLDDVLLGVLGERFDEIVLRVLVCG
jgi:hypothetical protein